ncbi:MAG: hypothetical protein RXQ93_00020 [Caldisphaera sp.]
MSEWRQRLLQNHLLIVLIGFELILSLIFLIVSYITRNIYFRGVVVGLLIAGVTSLIAYLFQRNVVKK